MYLLMWSAGFDIRAEVKFSAAQCRVHRDALVTGRFNEIDLL